MDTDVDRARWRGTANLRVLPKLQLGLEFNLAAEEIGPLATWFLLTERARLPGLFVGTSSDRIGSPKGEQSYYLTAVKDLYHVPVSAYVSLNYSEWDEGFNVPFGGTLRLWRGSSVRAMYDGERTHLLAGYQAWSATVSLLWVWLEDPGVSVSYGF